MKRKTVLAAVLMGVLIGVTPILYAYVSAPAGHIGKVDNETTWAMAGDTIAEGMVCSWEQDYNAYTSAYYDTYGVVIRSEDENDSDVAGIAMMDAVPGQSVKLLIRGEVSCKIDGSDSVYSGNGPACTTIGYGTVLSVSSRDGFLGAAATDMWGCTNTINHQQHVYRTMPVGKCLADTVAIADTGALTTYRCYIDCRSRF